MPIAAQNGHSPMRDTPALAKAGVSGVIGTAGTSELFGGLAERTGQRVDALLSEHGVSSGQGFVVLNAPPPGDPATTLLSWSDVPIVLPWSDVHPALPWSDVAPNLPWRFDG